MAHLFPATWLLLGHAGGPVLASWLGRWPVWFLGPKWAVQKGPAAGSPGDRAIPGSGVQQDWELGVCITNVRCDLKDFFWNCSVIFLLTNIKKMYFISSTHKQHFVVFAFAKMEKRDRELALLGCFAVVFFDYIWPYTHKGDIYSSTLQERREAQWTTSGYLWLRSFKRALTEPFHAGEITLPPPTLQQRL